MRGISAIISMILIVMIVVALVGMLWAWLPGLFYNLAESTENATEIATSNLGMKFRFEAANYEGTDYVDASIRNVGTVNIDLSKLGIYIDGVLCPSFSPNSGTLTPGDVDTIRVINTTESCLNKVIKVTLENGYEDYRTISC